MPPYPPPNALRFKRRLLRWFRRSGRDLPWRTTRDPYRVIVSEFMLQQTQVTRVKDFYRRFLDRFPDLAALAAAPPRQVREAWEGLGYYRRATNLHHLARTVAAEQGGRIPADPAQLRRLPGVGPYTAGAVASFAFEKRAPAVDTNVARVLGRVFGRAGSGGARRGKHRERDRAKRQRPGARRSPIARAGGAGDRKLWDLAAQILPRRPRTAWEFNQALMDLGALYCTARAPKCPTCPVRPACRTGARNA